MKHIKTHLRPAELFVMDLYGPAPPPRPTRAELEEIKAMRKRRRRHGDRPRGRFAEIRALAERHALLRKV